MSDEVKLERTVLTWQFYPDNGHHWTVGRPWSIHGARDDKSYGDGTKRIAPFKIEGSIYVGCETLDAAKALAQRLQNVLDGGTLRDSKEVKVCPTDHHEVLRVRGLSTREPTRRPWTFKEFNFCPDCGTSLSPDATKEGE